MWWKKIIPILLSAIIILSYAVKIQAEEDPTAALGYYPKEYINMKNPLPFDPPTLRKGRKIYNGHCEVCHGGYGDGKGRASLISKYRPMPRDFTNSAKMAQKTDGMLFYSISKGVHGTRMFAREEIMSEKQRWAVIHYIRTFAKDEKE
ncbi:MAG: cytochrome c [Thermodesulfobacteriota bacterium]